MAKNAKNAKPEAAKTDAKPADKPKAVQAKGVKIGSDISRARKSLGLTLSAIQKNINLQKDHGRHTRESREIYWDYRRSGLLGPAA